MLKDGITRRDFIGGVALGTPAALMSRGAAAAPDARGDAGYPPLRHGLRGSHPGSFEVAHAVRDGARLDVAGTAPDETHDLVIVGAGISGLAAAYYYRQRHPRARILVLDSHDDFGGHAKRNEFEVDGQLLLGYGGTQSIDSPKGRYRGVPAKLLKDLGIDVERFTTAYDRTEYERRGMKRAIFFKREAFGVDRLVREPYARWDDFFSGAGRKADLQAVVDQYPVGEAARRTLVDMITSDRDVLAGHSTAERMKIIQGTSYRDFISQYWGADTDVLKVLQTRTHGLWAVGIDAVSVSNTLELPGCQSLRRLAPEEHEEPYVYHFPDGNASIARLLVRRLVPGAAPGHTMDDIVVARFDDGALDLPSQDCRIRLQSTAVDVRNDAGGVSVAYVQQGRLRRATARHAILAGYQSLVPHIAPDVSGEQRAAFGLMVRAPLVYVALAARNWRPWEKLGIASFGNPGGMYSALLDFPVKLDSYRYSAGPDHPMSIHLEYIPTDPNKGLSMRDQFKAGRRQLLAMSFEEFEAPMRDELGRILGPGGFDFDRDIAAIVVNRWPHGYAYTPDPLWDDPAGTEKAAALARRRIGNIAIAGSDAGWDAYTDVAIREAFRAVHDLGA